ncbi:hypothetical protein Tco_0361252 [Tanacetum coccineum]
MTNKKVSELDVEFIEYKVEAKASMDALKKKIDDGIGKLDMSIKAMKEESDAKFEELKQLILGTAPSQSTHVDHVPQITKVAAKAAPVMRKTLQFDDRARLALRQYCWLMKVMRQKNETLTSNHGIVVPRLINMKFRIHTLRTSLIFQASRKEKNNEKKVKAKELERYKAKRSRQC